MLFSYPHPQRHTFHREKEHPLHCLPKLTQHFSHNSFVTVMKQLWISAGLHRYHLSNGPLVQKTKRFKVFFSYLLFVQISTNCCCWCMCAGVFVCFVCYLYLCQQVHSWIQIPWFAWTHPERSTRQERPQSPKLNMNRCCFIFRGRAASSGEAADCLTSYRT